MARLRFTRWVPDDLAAALDWYDSKSTGLGNRFRAACDAAFTSIESSPELYPYAFPDIGVRFYRLKHFPYVILYREKGGSILIVTVCHGASDPKKWRERAKAT